jgi:mono/diheme cytochrome c family protein
MTTVLLLVSFLSVGWAQTSARPPVKPVPAATKAQLEQGKLAYMKACIQCHNRDPNVKGSLGPEMVDAPLEVMQSKVATGLYPNPLPKGFVPKRKTKAMRKLPNSLKDVPNIWLWVQSVKKKKK